MTWVLILMLTSDVYSGWGVASSAVPGFTSQAQCAAAGQSAVRNFLPQPGLEGVYYVCAPQGAKL